MKDADSEEDESKMQGEGMNLSPGSQRKPLASGPKPQFDNDGQIKNGEQIVLAKNKKNPEPVHKPANGKVSIFMKEGRVSLKPENEMYKGNEPEESNSEVSVDPAQMQTLG